MSAKGSNSQTSYKVTAEIVEVGKFVRFSDGSKLSAAKDQVSASEAGSNPIDVGQYRLYESGGTLYVCLKDLTAPNPTADTNLAGYRIMCMLGQS